MSINERESKWEIEIGLKVREIEFDTMGKRNGKRKGKRKGKRERERQTDRQTDRQRSVLPVGVAT